MYQSDFTPKLLLGLVFMLLYREPKSTSACRSPISARSPPVADAMGAARADRTHRSRQRAHELPYHRAGLFRVDKIFSGNRYNLRLWLAGFNSRLAKR